MLVSLACLAAGCGGGGGGDSQTPPPSTQTQADAAQGGGCEQAQQPPPRKSGNESKPKEKLPVDKDNAIVVETNCGAFTIALDPKAAPKTTASVAELARKGFYDQTTFHRIVPGFVIQGGDPTGTGTGGPGYKTVDKPPSGTRYTKGVVAMAKAGNEAPGTAGSQFFVVTGDDAAQLPPDYALLGELTSGQPVVEKIGAIITDPRTDAPDAPVVIESIRVVER